MEMTKEEIVRKYKLEDENMTNGEKLKEVFPNMEWEVKDNTVLTDVDNGSWFSLEWWNAEYKESTTPNDCETCIHNKGVLECDMYGCKYEPTTKNNLAQERYQDLIEHFGDEKVAKAILESRKEFTAWLERIRWTVKRADELARELEQIKGTTKNETFGSNNPLEWLGKNCKDCGNEKCKKLGTLPKGYSCALWQSESEG